MKTFIFIILFICGANVFAQNSPVHIPGVQYELDGTFTNECMEYENTLVMDPIFELDGGIMKGVLWRYRFEYLSPISGNCLSLKTSPHTVFSFNIPETNDLLQAKMMVYVEAYRNYELIGKTEFIIPICKVQWAKK